MNASANALRDLSTLLKVDPADLTGMECLDPAETAHFQSLVERELTARQGAVDAAVSRSGDLLPGPLRRLVVKQFFRR